MTKRRRQGEGSVFERKNKDGKIVGYVAFLDLGRVGGKRTRRKFQGRTFKEVRDRLDEAKHQNKHGVLVAAGKHSTAAWMEKWLRDIAKPNVKPSTYRSYEGFVTQHIVPTLGHIALDKLTVADVRGLLLSRKGLSQRSVHHLRAVLRNALNDAIDDDLIPNQRNVAAGKKLLAKVPDVTMKAYDSEQARAFLLAVQRDPLEAVYVVALTTGLRQGEVLGLRWRNVDLAGRTLRVEKALQRIGGIYQLVDPKSEKSKRVVPLSDMTVNALRQHKEQQQEPGGMVALDWHDLVFRTATGEPLNGTWINHKFQAASKAAGLPRLRFHDLRHSCVSLLGAMGVDVAVVSKMVGHSSVTLTLNTYRHVFERAERAAASAMDVALGVG